jgi:hypothetical protein
VSTRDELLDQNARLAAADLAVYNEAQQLRTLARDLAVALGGAVKWLDNIAAGAPPLIDGRAAERQVLLGMPNNVLGRDAMRGLLERARALGVTP